MIAPPSGRPALTKPNTLPIWPGGAASFSITSRGVRLAPKAVPAMKVSTQTPTPSGGSQLTASIVRAEIVVSVEANTSTHLRCLSTNQPPTSTPIVPPTM